VVRLLVFARHGLTDCSLRREEPALLLEGSWPADASAGQRWSLDQSIDDRFAWIDQLAADWARSLAGVDLLAAKRGQAADCGSLVDCVSPAYLNALALQYYLVKLIRVLAYFTELGPLGPGDCLELTAAAGRDEDYADVLSQYCRSVGAQWRVRWVEGMQASVEPRSRNPLWRRWAAGICRRLLPAVERADSQRRVVLCGDGRLLDPICRQLLLRRCHVWWLGDRFSLRSWLHWQSAGVGQLVCNSSLGRENQLRSQVPDRLEFHNVDLAVPIHRWLAGQIAAHGAWQSRLVGQIERHFRSVRPQALVLDADTTPLGRAAVAAARRCGAASFVVQHGAPCCRFGFSLPAADRFLVWGRSSRQMLRDWGVPPQRIRITGSPQHEQPHQDLKLPGGCRPVGHAAGAKYEQMQPPRILLLTPVPPRDDRPGPLALHLTTSAYAEMLRIALATVEGIHGVELLIRPCPCGAGDPVLRAVQAEFPSLGSRLVARSPLQRWFHGVDCVLSCSSGEAVEAVLAGLPVIQLAPPGANGALPHDQWAVVGTAQSEVELQRLLVRVLVEGWHPRLVSRASVLAAHGEAAAARIAEEVLSAAGDSRATTLKQQRFAQGAWP
jgi:hypothetical protein